MTPRQILDHLVGEKAVRLSALPDDFGIYALRDHGNKIRYIGCTYKPAMGFRVRIFRYHKTGTEGRSHKFSQAYCCGRMWRFSKKLHGSAFKYLDHETDANVSKKLRNAFIEAYCSAQYLPLPAPLGTADYFAYLKALEMEVQSLAPAEMRRWEGIYFEEEDEPTDFVDALILKGACRDLAAIERQRDRYSEYRRAQSPAST
jgi:hypothetical protein